MKDSQQKKTVVFRQTRKLCLSGSLDKYSKSLKIHRTEVPVERKINQAKKKKSQQKKKEKRAKGIAEYLLSCI